MIVVPFIPSAAAPTQNNSDGEAVANESADSSGFADLLSMFVAVAPQAATNSDQTDGGLLAEPASQPPETDPSSQGAGEISLDPSAILNLLSPALISVAVSDPKSSLDSGAIVGAAIPSPTAASRDSLDVGSMQSVPSPITLEPSAAGDSFLQHVAAENDQAPVPTDAPRPTLATLEPLAAAENDQAAVPIGAAPTTNNKGIDPADKNLLSPVAQTSGNASPAPSGVVDAGKTDSTITAPLLKAPRANVSEGKLSVNADRQDEISSSNFDGTAVPVQAKANQEHLPSDGQFNMPKPHGESLREPAELKLGEESLNQLDPSSARSAHVQPDVSVMASQHHESIANDNATTMWRPVVDRVAQEIKAHVELGKHEAIIQLDPPELGKIKIDLRLDGDQLQARIITEEGHTKSLIESHLTELRQALETGQLDLRNIRVDQQDAPSAGGQWAEGFRDAQGQGEGQGQSRGDAGGGDPIFNDSAQIDNSQRRQIDAGRISMWA